jgi:hypothetical protein
MWTPLISARSLPLVFYVHYTAYDCSARHGLTSCAGGSNGAFVSMRIGIVQYVLRLTAVLQVYGGGVSVVVHPYVWSSSSYEGGSSASAGSTTVTGLSAVFIDCNFSGGTVSTRTISAPTRVVIKFLFALPLRLFYTRVHSLALSQARPPGWQHLDLMYDVLIDHSARV